MAQTFQTTRRVEFRDTDAGGIAHFSVFFTYMEQVEHELLRHLGLSVFTADDQGPISWPRVAVDCDYRSAVHFEDELQIEAQITRAGQMSLTYEFRFSHQDLPVAVGHITAVCCRMHPESKPTSMPIPAWILEKLAPFLPE